MDTDYYSFNPVEAFELSKRNRTLDEPLEDAGPAEPFKPFAASSSSSHDNYVPCQPFSPPVPHRTASATSAGTVEYLHRPPTTITTTTPGSSRQNHPMYDIDATKQPIRTGTHHGAHHHHHQEQHQLRDRTDRSSWAEIAKNEDKLTRGTTVTVTSPETKMYNPYSPKLLSGSRNNPSTSDEVLLSASSSVLPPFFQDLCTRSPKHYGEPSSNRHSRGQRAHSYPHHSNVQSYHRPTPTYVSRRHPQAGYDYPRGEGIQTHPRYQSKQNFQLQPVDNNTMYQRRRADSEDSKASAHSGPNSGHPTNEENKENQIRPMHRSGSSAEHHSHRHPHHRHSIDVHHHANHQPRYWNSDKNNNKIANTNNVGRNIRYDNNRGNKKTYSSRSENIYSFPAHNFRSRKQNFTKPHQVRYAVMCVSALCDTNNIILSNMVFGPNVLKIAIRSSAQLENIEVTMKTLISMPEIVVEEVSVPSVDTVTKRKRGFLIFMKLKDDNGIEKVVSLFADNGFKVNKVINPVEQTSEKVSKLAAFGIPALLEDTPIKKATDKITTGNRIPPLPQKKKKKKVMMMMVNSDADTTIPTTPSSPLEDEELMVGLKKKPGLSITVPKIISVSVPITSPMVVVTTPLAVEHSDVMVDETTKSETGSEEEKDSSVVLEDSVGNVMILEQNKETEKEAEDSYAGFSMVHSEEKLPPVSALHFRPLISEPSAEKLCTESIDSFTSLNQSTTSTAPSIAKEQKNTLICGTTLSRSSMHSQFANRTSFSSFDDLDLEDDDPSSSMQDELDGPHHKKLHFSTQTKRKRRRRKKTRKHSRTSFTVYEYLHQLPDHISLAGFVMIALLACAYSYSK